MLMQPFLDSIEAKMPPAPVEKVEALEACLGAPLPDDYRSFLIDCNGGSLGGKLWFFAPDGTPADVGIHHIGGFRREYHFSLSSRANAYEDRIPTSLMWIMDDPFGNAICLGIQGEERGKVFFWDHELEPDDGEWDGRIETAGNITLLSNSFADFVSGLQPRQDNE